MSETTLEIKRAALSDADDIAAVTRNAFQLYRDALPENTPLSVLTETVLDVLHDIDRNAVWVARQEGVLLGSIRVAHLSPELAYIFRFSVSPAVNNNGVGSGLLAAALADCKEQGLLSVALHTNSRYFKLARYYYGKEFYVHSTTFDRGYIRALFVKDLVPGRTADLSPALAK